MARIATKPRQNTFQTISDVSFFDAGKKIGENFESEILFFANLVWFWASHGRTGDIVKISLLVEFCSR